MNTTAQSATAATARPDTRTMVTVHRGLRRESRLLAELIAEVRPGDAARARTLTAHLRDYALGLHNHHHGEDELIWPLLLARVDLDADIVLRMEEQHERVAASLARVRAAADRWEATAAAPERDELVAALVEHRAVLVEHLDDEEAHLLPLAERHLTAAEWDAQGEHFANSAPKSKLLTFLGIALEDADAVERDLMLGGLPKPVRTFWNVAGRRVYDRRMRRVREGAPSKAFRIGAGLAALTGVGISYVGLSYLLDPAGTAPSFGLPAWPEGEAAGFLNIKGVRDLGTGLVVLVLMARREWRALGWAMAAFSTIPAGDALTILARDGSTATALGVHAATAVAVLASGILLLRGKRR
ncbi:DUF4267 domain-containing protein [Spirillospora sp. CA-253888]